MNDKTSYDGNNVLHPANLGFAFGDITTEVCMNIRTAPLDRDTFEHLINTSDKTIVQGLYLDTGYMVPFNGHEVTVIQQAEDMSMLYCMYKAYFQSHVRLLRQHRTYYVSIMSDKNVTYFDLMGYEPLQDLALTLARGFGHDYIYSIHGKDNIYMK